MTSQRAGTIADLVAALNPSVIRHAHIADPGTEVTGIRIHETRLAAESNPAQLVLAIGLDGPSEVVSLVLEIGASIAGLVIKCTENASADIEQAAIQVETSVLFIHEDIEWLQAMALLQSQLGSSWEPDGATSTTLAQDLFELSDLIATAVGGPVTVEDENGNLIAYSRDQQGGDDVRVRTLIARRSPADFTHALAVRGVPQRLAARSGPFIVKHVQPHVADRVAIGLQAGTYHLGSVWVLVTDPDPTQLAALTELSAQVALQLMRRRSLEAQSRRIEMEQLAILLHGGTSVTQTDQFVQLQSGTHWVAALDIAVADSTARAVTRARLEQRLALVPRNGEFTVIAGQLSNLLYLIITAAPARPASAAQESSAVQRWLAALLADRRGDTALPVHAGIGRAASSSTKLPRSRREAEQALAVAQTQVGQPEPVSFDDCWAQASLQRALDPALRADLENLTPLWRLRDHDREHATEYVATLTSWLEHQGNVREASAALHVHTNTMRYRIERLAAVAGVDLADTDVRLILSLQLWPKDIE